MFPPLLIADIRSVLISPLPPGSRRSKRCASFIVGITNAGQEHFGKTLKYHLFVTKAEEDQSPGEFSDGSLPRHRQQRGGGGVLVFARFQRLNDRGERALDAAFKNGFSAGDDPDWFVEVQQRIGK